MSSTAGRTTVAQRELAAAARVLPPPEQALYVGDASPRVRRVLASRADISAEHARRLGGDPDRQVRERLAANPGCPPDVLISLLGDPQFHVRWGAAQNPSATAEVHLAGLAGGDRDVAEAIGQLGDLLAVEVLDALMRHPASTARERLAEVTTSLVVLRQLAADSAPAVRATVALSAAVSEDLLRRLAQDPMQRVRATVAFGDRTPPDVVSRLAADKSSNVRWWAGAR